jgi:hypothetical protein
MSKVNERKATMPPAQRAYGPEGTVNSEPVNAYSREDIEPIPPDKLQRSIN